MSALAWVGGIRLEEFFDGAWFDFSWWSGEIEAREERIVDTGGKGVVRVNG